ncbi:hypothetical protein N482_18555 [Pseudoalteromonas luteoviolacea NCIMB 1942]|uniref:AraC effector-binding domain-containing protein n=1 Tax=Pseudoalteromonas luteoviolacea NCIMB 1942 TaxID=1365253 RepID=A0A162A468_9GAMM|nr:GyrI-like domain-containing protein [Pseudoalteromonas luteoviolacea]KZN43831.1 hypothetical protein N482_18555 [Pseudoalteromonas luteoviolacea NCIMB 1942]
MDTVPEVEITSFEETLIAVNEHRGDPRKLGTSIKPFIDWRRENNLPPSASQTFNLLYNDPNLVSADEYQFDIGCAIDSPVKENTLDVVTKRIPAGDCAVLRHIGSDDTLGISVNYLYVIRNLAAGFCISASRFSNLLGESVFFP